VYVPANATGIDRLSFIGVYSSTIVAINMHIIEIEIFKSENNRTIANELIKKETDPSIDFRPINILP
jgi:hypothetical protein